MSEHPTESNRHGGARPGAGRKPQAVLKLKRALLNEATNGGNVPPRIKADAAGYAFRLFVRTMKDETQPIETRLACASEVLNRTLGKPRQAVELSSPIEAPIRLIEVARPAVMHTETVECVTRDPHSLAALPWSREDAAR
jgi:hypothetical protein